AHRPTFSRYWMLLRKMPPGSVRQRTHKSFVSRATSVESQPPMDQSPFLDRPNRDPLLADYFRPGPSSTARLSTSMMSLLLKQRPSFQKTGLWLGRSEFGPVWLRRCSVKGSQLGLF